MGSLSLVSRDRLLICLILSLALLHGLIYVFTVPPWEHYDEPNHFEYVWLTANLDRLPTEADNSAKLSRMVVKSMIENGFYEHRPNKPVVGPTSEKLVVPGYSQLGDPPGYYVLASLPLRLLSSSSIDVQLYSARLVSVIFLLITVCAGWGIANELTGPGHPLRWILPASLALTPAFVDLMSSVNNETAAVGIASLFLWTAVRLVRRGFSWLDFLLLFFLGWLTFWIKNTAVMILAILPLVLLFTFLRGRARKAAWLILLLGSIAFLLTGIRNDDAFAWFRNTSQPEPTRQQNLLAPAGRYVLAVQAGEEVSPPFFPEVFQHHPGSAGKNLAGKQVTFGYWIWSDRRQQVKSPELRVIGATYSELLTLTLEPKFYAFSIKLPENTSRIWIYLSPGSDQRGSHIYYDGLVLVEGSRPTNEIPSFNTPAGEDGVWAGEPFKNFLRNGSAELPALRFSPWLDNFAAKYLPDGGRPSMLVGALLDPYSTSDLYPTTAIHLFQTFWAKFGWGQLQIIGNAAIYQILWFFTLFGFIGALIGVFRNPRTIPWDCVIVLASISVFYFLMALTRGGIYLANSGYYYSVARYFYPTIIPWLMVISLGWLEWIQLGKTLTRNRSNRGAIFDSQASDDMQFDSGSKEPYVIFLGFFLVLDVLSIISIYQYYY